MTGVGRGFRPLRECSDLDLFFPKQCQGLNHSTSSQEAFGVQKYSMLHAPVVVRSSQSYILAGRQPSNNLVFN